MTRVPTEQTTLVNLLSKFHSYLCDKYAIADSNILLSSHSDLMPLKSKDFFQHDQLCVYTENYGQQRKQNGKYEKHAFHTMIDLFRNRIFIEYPVLFISLNQDENTMMNYLLGSTTK
jgi:hypothetical protein